MNINVKSIEDIANQLAALLPEGLQGVKADVESNFKAVLRNAFAEMDLVTREEFDVQTQVLHRTRAKLDKMEQQIAELEAKLAKDST